MQIEMKKLKMIAISTHFCVIFFHLFKKAVTSIYCYCLAAFQISFTNVPMASLSILHLLPDSLVEIKFLRHRSFYVNFLVYILFEKATSALNS